MTLISAGREESVHYRIRYCQFSKTPLKHCMSRYLLEKILEDEVPLEQLYLPRQSKPQHNVHCAGRR